METPEGKRIEVIAYEAFLRRAAELDLPFMLKGSYVTRQYFPNPEDRIPNDLDWAYLDRLEYKDDATRAFDEWMILITEQHESDGVRFSRFRDNAFWRMLDYAMADDFPTVNTDLDCWVDGESIYPCQIDISFNLPVSVPPVPILYTPLRGKAFSIRNTVPLALQVSWKLHQTLTRPRFKDLFDLMHLVIHPTFTPEVLQQILAALVDECAMDGTHPGDLHYLLNGNWDKLFTGERVDQEWDYWRHGVERRNIMYSRMDEKANRITNPDKLPIYLFEFKEKFRQAFTDAGFYAIDLNNLPVPSWKNEIADKNSPVQPVPKAKKEKSRFGFIRKLFR